MDNSIVLAKTTYDVYARPDAGRRRWHRGQRQLIRTYAAQLNGSSNGDCLGTS